MCVCGGGRELPKAKIFKRTPINVGGYAVSRRGSWHRHLPKHCKCLMSKEDVRVFWAMRSPSVFAFTQCYFYYKKLVQRGFSQHAVITLPNPRGGRGIALC